jgi:hypothetical protein
MVNITVVKSTGEVLAPLVLRRRRRRSGNAGVFTVRVMKLMTSPLVKVNVGLIRYVSIVAVPDPLLKFIAA